MPISDLTGYTWVGNSDLSSGLSLNEFIYRINFTVGGLSFGSISWWDPSADYDDIYSYQLDYSNGSSTLVYKYLSGWENEAYKTIVITGGTDATNETLIAWLEANGTLTAPAPAATPSLNFGGSDVSLFFGSTYVSKVYLGSTLLYEGEAPSVALISFEVGNTTYQAEQGMTWENWVASNYNTAGYYSQIGAIWEASGNNVVGRFVDEIHISSTPVNPTDTITANSEYTLVPYRGGND